MPAIGPMIIGDMPPTKPAHGVIATSPATAPEQAPRVVAWPALIFSTTSQPSMPAAAARWVLTSACAAMPLAASADPALKPNQPNHRMPVPSTVKRQVVRRHRLGAVPAAAADHGDDGERCDAGVDVDRRAAGEVEGAHVEDPAAGVPHPVRDGGVHERSTRSR